MYPIAKNNKNAIKKIAASAALICLAGLSHAQNKPEEAPVSEMLAAPAASDAEVSNMGVEAPEAQLATYAVEGEVRFMTDNRNRGVSDSNNKPALRANISVAHNTGLVGMLEANTVSRQVFPNVKDMALTAAVGWRGGDSEALHYGIGLAREQIVGGKLQNVVSDLDLTPTLTDVANGIIPPAQPTPLSNPYDANFNTSFLVLEGGYGNFDARVLYVLSKNYRGTDKGTYCKTLLGYADSLIQAGDMAGAGNFAPQVVDCYNQPARNSRGSWLLDLDYKIPLTPNVTWVTLHAGYQHVNHFSQANFVDYKIGITHKWQGFEWTAEAMKAQTKNRVLFKNVPYTRQLDNATIVLSVARKF